MVKRSRAATWGRSACWVRMTAPLPRVSTAVSDPACHATGRDPDSGRRRWSRSEPTSGHDCGRKPVWLTSPRPIVRIRFTGAVIVVLLATTGCVEARSESDYRAKLDALAPSSSQRGRGAATSVIARARAATPPPVTTELPTSAMKRADLAGDSRRSGQLGEQRSDESRSARSAGRGSRSAQHGSWSRSARSRSAQHGSGSRSAGRGVHSTGQGVTRASARGDGPVAPHRAHWSPGARESPCTAGAPAPTGALAPLRRPGPLKTPSCPLLRRKARFGRPDVAEVDNSVMVAR